jgi:hypothetical protein
MQTSGMWLLTQSTLRDSEMRHVVLLMVLPSLVYHYCIRCLPTTPPAGALLLGQELQEG